MEPNVTYVYNVKRDVQNAECPIQGVPGGKDLTPGGCSLGQTIPI